MSPLSERVVKGGLGDYPDLWRPCRYDIDQVHSFVTDIVHYADLDHGPYSPCQVHMENVLTIAHGFERGFTQTVASANVPLSHFNGH